MGPSVVRPALFWNHGIEAKNWSNFHQWPCPTFATIGRVSALLSLPRNAYLSPRKTAHYNGILGDPEAETKTCVDGLVQDINIVTETDEEEENIF